MNGKNPHQITQVRHTCSHSLSVESPPAGIRFSINTAPSLLSKPSSAKKFAPCSKLAGHCAPSMILNPNMMLAWL
jgi:hypothetical protein